MATIPRLRGQRVRTAPLPGVSASPQALAPGVGVLAEATRTLGALEQAQRVERQRADEVVVNESEVALRSALTKVLYDPKSGAMFRRGLDAQRAPDDAVAAYRTAASKIESGLATPEQRDAFRVVVQRHEASLQQQVTGHAGSEFQRVNDETYESLTKSELEDIAARAGEPGFVDAAVTRLRTSTAQYADRAGWSPEMVEQRVEHLTSVARGAQIDALLRAGKVETADAMYAAHRTDLQEKERLAIREDLDAATLTQSASQAAAKALQGASTRAETEARLAAITDPEVRSLARKMTDAEWKRTDEAKQADQEALYERWAPAVEQAGANAVLESIVPAPDLNRMTADQRQSLRVRGNAPQENDASRWMEFYLMDPNDRAKLSPVEFQTKYWSRFDSAHRSDAERMYQVARGVGGSGTQGGGSTGTLTDQQRVRNTLVSLYIVQSADATDWSPAEERLAAAFTDEYDRRVRQWFTDKKSITDEDRATIAGDIGVEFATFTEQGTGRRIQGAELAGRLPGVNRQNVVQPYDKIPLNRRQALERAIRDNGLQPARDRVERAYSAELRGDTALYDRMVGRRVAPVPTNPDLLSFIEQNRFRQP